MLINDTDRLPFVKMTPNIRVKHHHHHHPCKQTNGKKRAEHRAAFYFQSVNKGDTLIQNDETQFNCT